MKLEEATREKSKLRLALVGPEGAGKTFTGFVIAKYIARVEGNRRFAFIDSENGSSSRYKPRFGPYQIVKLEPHEREPEDYIRALNLVIAGGAAVVVIDSLSHAWQSLLAAVDAAASTRDDEGNRGNGFGAWRNQTPRQNALVDALVQCPIHVIACMRAKTEWVVESNSKGKQAPRKVGVGPVQRAGIGYEFDVVLDMTNNGTATVSKTRCEDIAGRVIRHPGEPFAKTLHDWITEGVEPPKPPGYVPPATTDAGWVHVLAASDAMHLAVTKEELEEAWRAWAAKVNNGAGVEVAKQERGALRQWCAFLGSRLGGQPWKPTDDEMALVEMLRSARARVVPAVVNDNGEAAEDISEEAPAAE